MIHILVGAALGALAGTVGYVVVGTVLHRKLTLKGAAAACLGGILGGAVTAATLGVGGFAAATSEEAIIAGALGGSLSGGVERATNDVLIGQKPGVDVIECAGVAAFSGGLLGGTDKLIVPGINGVAGAIAQKSERKLLEGVTNQSLGVSATPGIVGGLRSQRRDR